MIASGINPFFAAKLIALYHSSEKPTYGFPCEKSSFLLHKKSISHGCFAGMICNSESRKNN
jgi:hypothetical protein